MKLKNQYILVNKKLPEKEGWNHIEIGEYNLYFDENITFNEVQEENGHYILLGNLIHIYKEMNESNVLNNLQGLIHEQIFEETSNWCGHFILISKTDCIKIYNNACASFKIYYGNQGETKLIGSDPKILTLFSNFETATEGDKSIFYNSNYFQQNRNKIGNETRYHEIFQVVSNHCLDLNSMKSIRMFPKHKRETLTVDEAIKELVPIFQHIIRNLEKHYNLFVSMTAGYDSRLLISTTKKIKDKITYYTIKFPTNKSNHIDYKIPKLISKKLKLNYVLKNLNPFMTSVERNNIENTYDLPRLKSFIQYQYPYFKNTKKNKKKKDILLVGVISEVAKNYLERINVSSGKDIVRSLHFPDNNYLESYFQTWYHKNNTLIKNLDYELLDFLHWEQDITNYAGQNIQYAHHYQPIFSIFNCRKVLEIMLSVDPKYRDTKSPILYKRLIDYMWSDLLNFPFNPTIKEKTILFLKKIKMYRLYKWFLIKFYSKKLK